MSKLIKLFCIITISIFCFYFTSCELDLDEENFIEVEAPNLENKPPLNLDLVGITNDTIVITQNTTLYYNYDINQLNLNSLKFTLEDRSWNSSNPEGEFTIYIIHYENGFYNLNLELHTRTNSESMSDKTRFESFKYERSWVIKIEK